MVLDTHHWFQLLAQEVPAPGKDDSGNATNKAEGETLSLQHFDFLATIGEGGFGKASLSMTSIYISRQ